MTEELFPTDLTRDEQGRLIITWCNGQRRVHTAAVLRKICPCATCREKRNESERPKQSKSLPVLSSAEARPLSLLKMLPVGNYAYNIAFSDGHDSGIYNFDMLFETGEPLA